MLYSNRSASRRFDCIRARCQRHTWFTMIAPEVPLGCADNNFMADFPPPSNFWYFANCEISNFGILQFCITDRYALRNRRKSSWWWGCRFPPTRGCSGLNFHAVTIPELLNFCSFWTFTKNAKFQRISEDPMTPVWLRFTLSQNEKLFEPLWKSRGESFRKKHIKK